MDFAKADRLIVATSNLTDAQIAVLFENVSGDFYGDERFNESVEKALNKMKVTEYYKAKMK